MHGSKIHTVTCNYLKWKAIIDIMSLVQQEICVKRNYSLIPHFPQVTDRSQKDISSLPPGKSTWWSQQRGRNLSRSVAASPPVNSYSWFLAHHSLEGDAGSVTAIRTIACAQAMCSAGRVAHPHRYAENKSLLCRQNLVPIFPRRLPRAL